MNRIQSLDVIRGVAVCGILFMNILNFSMLHGSYLSPEVGNETGIDYVLFCLQHVIIDQKAMALFSMLFGAGAVMLRDKLLQRTGNTKTFYWRMLLLFVLGIAHFSFNAADILHIYALLGLILPIFWYLPMATLAKFGATCWGVIILLTGYFYLQMTDIHNADITLEAILHNRFEESLSEQVDMFFAIESLLSAYLRALGMMLIGISLYQNGFLSGKKSMRTYRRVASVFGISGVFSVLLGLGLGMYFNFLPSFWLFLGYIGNLIGTPLLAIAYVALIHLWLKSARFNCQGFASMGRMALTNYVLQTFVILYIFVFGLALYGELKRWEIWLIVCGVLTGQMLLSIFWLHYFRYGPLEYIWRALTYGRLRFD